MLRLKSCPRCRGDVIIDRDSYGWYEQCLQCGHQRELENLDYAQTAREEHGRSIRGSAKK